MLQAEYLIPLIRCCTMSCWPSVRPVSAWRRSTSQALPTLLCKNATIHASSAPTETREWVTDAHMRTGKKKKKKPSTCIDCLTRTKIIIPIKVGLCCFYASFPVKAVRAGSCFHGYFSIPFLSPGDFETNISANLAQMFHWTQGCTLASQRNKHNFSC